jgi:hypothetical protein
MKMIQKTGTKQNIISYDTQRLIKIFDVDKDTSVSYLIKTLLEIINRWDRIEIHVLNNKGDEKK